jgi:hypothetical protein
MVAHSYLTIARANSSILKENTVFKVTVKTQQQCIYISILLWQHVSVLLNHLQANIQRYEVQSVHIMYYVCLFSQRYNPLWLYFHRPIAGFSLLIFEVS